MNLCQLLVSTYKKAIQGSDRGCKINSIVLSGGYSSFISDVGNTISSLKIVNFGQPVDIIRILIDNEGSIPDFNSEVSPEISALIRLGFCSKSEGYIVLDNELLAVYTYLVKTNELNKLKRLVVDLKNDLTM